MRKDFVANVSHELRTPLTAIKGCAETLVDGAIDDDDAAARFLQVIATHSDRLTNLLNDLLDLSRLESDELEIEAAPCNVRALAESSIESVAQIAARRGIAIDVSVGAEIRALCDRKLIEQALINLIENAVKYSAENGRVEVGARILSRAETWAPFSPKEAGAAGPRPPGRRRRKEGGGHPPPGRRYRDRHPVGGGHPGFRALLPRRQGPFPGNGGDRPRALHRPPRGRGPRRARLRRQRAGPRVDLRVHPSGRLTNLRGRGQGRTTIGDCLLLLLPGAASPITSTRHLAGLTGPRRRK